MVKERLNSAITYFGVGVGTTGILTGMLRNSRLAHANPLLMLIPTFGSLFATMYLNSQEQWVPKHLAWLTFQSCMALSLVPLINMASMPIIYNALFATGIMMGGLTMLAVNAPNEQFLNWGGMLGIGLAGSIGLGIVNMFWPSPIMTNILLYGGLVLFGGFVLYDTQKLIYNAKTRPNWDPLNESIGMYLDAIILF